MTKIKLCGLTRLCDIEEVNGLKPEYIGFVFAPKSRRYIDPEKAAGLKQQLDPNIRAVGVFVKEKIETVAGLLNRNVIDLAQLHGGEDEEYIQQLRQLTDKPIIKAFRMDTEQDILNAEHSTADFILLDSGAGGTGTTFDWNLLKSIQREYFLAGGLGIDNVKDALEQLQPYAVDVSSGIETDGWKDEKKMKLFVHTVRAMQ